MPTLITGGCGFIGINLAHRLLSAGRAVHLYDSLASPGSERNLHWLRERHKAAAQDGLLTSEIADLRDWRTLSHTLKNASEVYHLAAQERVSISRQDPLIDFEVNALGTVRLLNAIRESGRRIPVIFTSSSKVYGPLSGLKLKADGNRYRPCDRKFKGIDEQFPINPEGPYGCSKAVGDLYTLDFVRTYGLSAVGFRLGSVYGPNQLGSEDQGWVVHLMLQILRGQPITIYGDGKQVRDLLHVEDLVTALMLAQTFMERIKGQAFNLGGGQGNSMSLIEFLELTGRIGGRVPHVKFAPWRLGDQRYYVTDFTKFQQATRWAPRNGIRDGLDQLRNWMVETFQAPPTMAPRMPVSWSV